MGGQGVRVEWTTGAQRNLDAIEYFIAQDNPRAAANTVLKIVRRTFNQLSQHPSSGKPGRIHHTRELIYTEFPYLVIYTVRPDTIFILRVYHTAQDIRDLAESASEGDGA